MQIESPQQRTTSPVQAEAKKQELLIEANAILAKHSQHARRSKSPVVVYLRLVVFTCAVVLGMLTSTTIHSELSFGIAIIAGLATTKTLQ